MSRRLLFISDLHLQATRPDITLGLTRFLDAQRGDCDELYILGDLFEAWLGDDATDGLATQVANALSDFAAAGARVYLMHGNRDFLLGERFAEACGATLLPDPSLIETPIGSLLISHGDALCTDDVDYQRFRAVVREEAWQQEFLARPLEARIAFAREAREKSREATAGKTEEIMDVNADAVQTLLRTQQQRRLLHGHTHRPAMHVLPPAEELDEESGGWRLVLGDWDRQGWYAEITADGPRLEHFPLPAAGDGPQADPEASAAG